MTEQILAVSREGALEIQDCQYASDDLWHAHPISQRRDGRFSVLVEDATPALFAACRRRR